MSQGFPTHARLRRLCAAVPDDQGRTASWMRPRFAVGQGPRARVVRLDLRHRPLGCAADRVDAVPAGLALGCQRQLRRRRRQPARTPALRQPGTDQCADPVGIPGQSSVKVKVTVSGLQGPVVTVPLATYSPGFFEISGLAAAEDINFAVITSQPSGQTRRGGATVRERARRRHRTRRARASRAPPSRSRPRGRRPSVTVGGKAGDRSIFSGLTPGVVGLYQVNAILAPDTPTGDQQIVLSIGGVTSETSVLPVQ